LAFCLFASDAVSLLDFAYQLVTLTFNDLPVILD
jgi:hypothetical protein